MVQEEDNICCSGWLEHVKKACWIESILILFVGRSCSLNLCDVCCFRSKSCFLWHFWEVKLSSSTFC